MPGKKGINNVPGMRQRRKGGKQAPEPTQAPDPLGEAVGRWLIRLEERAYSPRTLDMNRWAIESFLKWSRERDLTDPAQIQKKHLEAYQRWLHRYRQKNGKPLGISTQRQRLGSIQRFFSHLGKSGQLQANPAADLELPRKPARRLPKGLSRQELARLLAIPDTRDPLGIRDRAILELLYATGARRSELVRIQLSHLDIQSETHGNLLIDRGKGGKSRLIPIGRDAIHWLQRYLDQTRPRLLLDPAEGALFLSGYGEALSPHYLGNWMKKTLHQAAIDKPGSCHLLRHTCATHMHEGGADIRFIQQFLGHARLDTTAIYTEVSIESLRAIYNQTHPSAQDPGEEDDKSSPKTDGQTGEDEDKAS